MTVVLPAEYGPDLTGVRKILRLTEMGNIKQQLAAEAEADAAATAFEQPPATTTDVNVKMVSQAPLAPAQSSASPKAPAVSDMKRRDETSVTLTPGEGSEIKLTMTPGARAEYSWFDEGGVVNFDTHVDAPGQSISYEKGRGVPADEGVLEAAVTGYHGWLWRKSRSSGNKNHFAHAWRLHRDQEDDVTRWRRDLRCGAHLLRADFSMS